jgi:hypothetical protein
MLGAKIYIDFTKYEFEECISRLKKELFSIIEIKNELKNEKKTPAQTVEVETNETKTEVKVSGKQFVDKVFGKNDIKKIIPETEISKPIVSHPAHLWTEAEINFWLIDKNISPAIILNVSPCDGKLLEQLFRMSKEVPEFFFSSLRADTNASLKDIAYFTSELKILFTF